MLAEAIIRIGRPIAQSDLPYKERIRWLTDVNSDSCKNFFQNVFIVEINNNDVAFQFRRVGELRKEGKKEEFYVNTNENVSFPVLFPNGGNPLNAQGVYPIPCYLMYDPHIKTMTKPTEFIGEVLLPRLNRTVSYRQVSMEEKERLAEKVASILAKHVSQLITSEKQLGILLIFDSSLPVYTMFSERKGDDPQFLWIGQSGLSSDMHLYMDGKLALSGILEARLDEASSLGQEQNAISTFSNRKEEKVVSIYNKSWLWLSPTWEMPKSIYWKDDEWTKGIKVDKESYEAFLYGAQFLKQITVPVSSAVLKEMFSPIDNVEAKKYKTNFDQIYGAPMVLPLLDGDSKQIYKKYRRMLRQGEAQQLNNNDLHLYILAGLREGIVPDSPDDYRLTILYYSGDLSRGAMHIRAMIEDVIPSVAREIQTILEQLKRKELALIQAAYHLPDPERPVYRTETLPALLGNAFGSGYIWSSLQKTLHREPLDISRLRTSMVKKLNELANKEDEWGMRHEIVFYFAFLYFFNQYQRRVLGQKEGVRTLADWQKVVERYEQGQMSVEEMEDAEVLGFVSGLLLKQFSNSYYHKTKKDFVKHRVMRFGSKLTPDMIWHNGLQRCEELAQQWDMGLASNFYHVLPHALLAFIEADKKKMFTSQKDLFMTAFWAGYLIYRKKQEEEVAHVGS